MSNYSLKHSGKMYGIKIILASFFMVLSSLSAMENPTIISVGIPKCGNHMLLKCLCLITQKKYWWLRNLAMMHLPKHYLCSSILSGHAIFIDSNVAVARSIPQVKGFFISRDPRDQVVSMAYYAHKKWDQQKNQSIGSLITELILDGPQIYRTLLHAPEIEVMRGISDFYQLYLPWINEPYMYSTTFEKLVGPQGGGDQEMQIAEIQKIAHHVTIELSREEAELISKKLWGESLTFRSGHIGSWKTHFTQEHKKLFKTIAGQLLIDLGYEEDLNW